MKSIKAWIYKHRKGLVIAGVVLVAAGVAAIIIINGKKVKVPLQVLAEVAPELPQVAETVSDTVTVKVGEIIKTFPRESFIRHLHAGWKASAEKIAQAASLGINLKDGETFVNACMVNMRAAA